MCQGGVSEGVFEGVSGVRLGIYLGHMPSISKCFIACQEHLWIVTQWTEE